MTHWRLASEKCSAFCAEGSAMSRIARIHQRRSWWGSAPVGEAICSVGFIWPVLSWKELEVRAQIGDMISGSVGRTLAEPEKRSPVVIGLLYERHMSSPDATSTAARERPLRRDAERNRRRILEAAAEVFAERGLAVTMDDIADHAGVGVGTVYRRFPNKDLLIDALLEDRLAELVAMAERAQEE